MKLVLVMMAATAFIEKTGFFGTFMKSICSARLGAS